VDEDSQYIILMSKEIEIIDWNNLAPNFVHFFIFIAMNKKAIRKAAYRSIFKEETSHQDTFEELKHETTDQAALAEELSKVPSRKIIEKYVNWKWALVVSLSLVVLFRIVASIMLFDQFGSNPTLIFLLIAGAVFVPAFGFYGIFTGKLESLRGVAVLIIISIFRGLTSNKGAVEFDIYMIIGLLPSLATIGLCFYIPSLMKTKYERKITKDSNNKTHVTFEFETFGIQDENLLDSDL
jgi:hypothetical protein